MQVSTHNIPATNEIAQSGNSQVLITAYNQAMS